MDIAFGAAIGSFNVLILRSRDYDCFSRMVDLGIRWTAYFAYYDEPFMGTFGQWLSMLLSVPLDANAVYGTGRRCW
jgi:hypothetical protein